MMMVRKEGGIRGVAKREEKKCEGASDKTTYTESGLAQVKNF
jgi:hypothetical protein